MGPFLNWARDFFKILGLGQVTDVRALFLNWARDFFLHFRARTRYRCPGSIFFSYPGLVFKLLKSVYIEFLCIYLLIVEGENCQTFKIRFSCIDYYAFDILL